MSAAGGRRAWLAGALALAVLPGAARAQGADAASPIGSWRTFDDHTGKERGVVRIWEQGGVLYGSIVSTVDPEEAKKRCVPCTDDRKDKPLIGLTIIRGLRRDGDTWSGGEILDPETGSVYRCRMQLEDGGKTLVVRGYMGISLIGRSQRWRRIT